MRFQKLIQGFVFSAAAIPILGGAALAWDQQQPGKMAKAPDLTKACAKECPSATNNDDVFKCVEDQEKTVGEKAFKKKHHACYKAHEKYEKITGKEEAG